MATLSTLPAQGESELHSVRTPKSREEMLAIFQAAREEVRAANPTGRDLLAELLEERRLEGLND